VLARGFNWRDGHGQYSKKTMTSAIKAKTIINDNLIQTQSKGAKYGRSVGFKQDYGAYLRKNAAYGDYSKGARHSWFEDPYLLDPEQGDGQWTKERRRHGTTGGHDVKEQAMIETNNRMGEQIYGWMEPDMVKVGDVVDRHDARQVGGENVGFDSHDTGLYQAGHRRIDWEEQGPRRTSDYDTDDNKVTHDHVRATMVSAPLRSYDPRTMWIGSGHMPGSKRMREIPFAV
jgi:hypothetical protein